MTDSVRLMTDGGPCLYYKIQMWKSLCNMAWCLLKCSTIDYASSLELYGDTWWVKNFRMDKTHRAIKVHKWSLAVLATSCDWKFFTKTPSKSGKLDKKTHMYCVSLTEQSISEQDSWQSHWKKDTYFHIWWQNWVHYSIYAYIIPWYVAKQVWVDAKSVSASESQK